MQNETVAKIRRFVRNIAHGIETGRIRPTPQEAEYFRRVLRALRAFDRGDLAGYYKWKDLAFPGK